MEPERHAQFGGSSLALIISKVFAAVGRFKVLRSSNLAFHLDLHYRPAPCSRSARAIIPPSPARLVWRIMWKTIMPGEHLDGAPCGYPNSGCACRCGPNPMNESPAGVRQGRWGWGTPLKETTTTGRDRCAKAGAGRQAACGVMDLRAARMAGGRRLGFKRVNTDLLVRPGTATGESAAAPPAPFRG